MSFVNASPGDVQYVQYAVVDTMQIASTVDIEKGHLYTVGTTGYLIEFIAASGALTNLNGVFQAMADSAAVSGEADGDRSVQCLARRSRIVVKGAANQRAGHKVTVSSTGTTVTADKVSGSTSHIIGTIFEILTRDGRTRKILAANNDLVVVDLI